MVSVAPPLSDFVNVVLLIEVDLILSTVEEEEAVTPMAARLALAFIAVANPVAIDERVSPARTV